MTGYSCLKNILRWAVPLKARQFRVEAPRLWRAAGELRAAADEGLTAEALVDMVLNGGPIRATQKRGEILGLMRRVTSLESRRVCEIGGAAGGTLFLLSRACPAGTRVLSVDLLYSLAQRLAYHRIGGPGQRITCLAADSHATRTVGTVRRWLSGEALDVLFIDGDHTYAGVREDFVRYAPLVRPGGIVALHDINPDYRTRFGQETAAWVGEVPCLWDEVKRAFPNCEELIEDPEQDGYGIGIVPWDGVMRLSEESA